MANSLDKERKKMNILVMANEQEDDKYLVRAKNIICPECGEDIKIKIKDFKIDLFDCKNKHEINNISLNEFESKQMIDLIKIKCDICKEKNKANTYNNELYKCYECNANICPICKLKHDKTHSIINYDKLHYTCIKHDEPYTSYCSNCKINVCTLCENDHLKHEMILLRTKILNKKELLIKLDNLRKSKEIFNENIRKMLETLNLDKINTDLINLLKENIENYYKLAEYIINNYNQKERNYEVLYNINEIVNYNIINYINNINEDNNIVSKFNKILINIYKITEKEKTNNNEPKDNKIILKLKMEKKDINNKIYFLDNTDGTYDFNCSQEKHYHDFLKELNESNVELYINDKKYKYEKFFIPDKEGEYEIKLIFSILIKDCGFMFYNCKNIIKIDLSSFKSQNVNNMDRMFSGCSNVENINLSLFNTQNVTNMKSLFRCCFNLKNLDLSSFNTQNVKVMSYMFNSCSNLRYIDLSSFITKEHLLFYDIFDYCSNLKEIKINKNFDVFKKYEMSKLKQKS